MPELLMYKFPKRVIFCPGIQRQFLLSAAKSSKLSWSLFADKIKVNKRTLNDWKREKYSLPFTVLKRISRVAKVKIPNDIEIRQPFWSSKKAGEVAGRLVYQKYGIIGGNPEIRKQRWLEWWNKTGRFNPNKYFIAKEITIPKKNTELAEFVGIMMGDGGITKRQIVVTLNHKTDRLYSIFVKNIIKKLFKIKPSIYSRKDESVVSIVVSRTRLVAFCKSLGLKVGNKLRQNLDIPGWVKKNKSFKVVCIRGLVDTDGCLFKECYRIKKKKYCYPRLSFASSSKRLRSSVFKILEELGFSPKIRNNRYVQLENREDIVKYFNLVDTNNPKHKSKFMSISGGVGSGYPKRS